MWNEKTLATYQVTLTACQLLNDGFHFQEKLNDLQDLDSLLASNLDDELKELRASVASFSSQLRKMRSQPILVVLKESLHKSLHMLQNRRQKEERHKAEADASAILTAPAPVVSVPVPIPSRLKTKQPGISRSILDWKNY